MLKKILLALILGLCAVTAFGVAGAVEFAGHWTGAISIGGTELSIELDIFSQTELTAYLSIPSQGLQSGELAVLRCDPPELDLALEITQPPALFYAVLGDAGLAGKFSQGGAEGSFSLERHGEPVLVEVAEFVIPDDVREEEVWLETESGAIYGRLMTPVAESANSVALIIAGSGPTDRDGNSTLLAGKNNSLLMLACGLAQNGIASLRFDKRGVGQSAEALASEEDIVIEAYVEDAQAWLQLLRGDPRWQKAYVLGHSEGALIGLLASLQEAPDGYVSLCGMGRNMAEVLRTQLGLDAGEGMEEAELILTELESGRRVETVSPELMSIFRPSVQNFLISVLRYNPPELLAALAVPSLILQGDTDLQISLEDAELLAEASPIATLRIIPGMNHVLKPAPMDRELNVKAYSDPLLPLADGLLSALLEFFQAN